MKASTLRLFTLLLLGGCAESVEQAQTVNNTSPAAEATAAADTPQVPSTAAEATPDTAEESSPVDAEVLLASTLANARTDDKRVLVHLGAPW